MLAVGCTRCLCCRVVKAERGSARRNEYVRQASIAAEERTKLMEATRSAIEEARCPYD